MKSEICSFGEFHIDRARRLLLRHGQPVDVSPKCLDLLTFLIDNRNRLVEKEELLQGLWPESFVDEHNVKQNIYVLRRILGMIGTATASLRRYRAGATSLLPQWR